MSAAGRDLLAETEVLIRARYPILYVVSAEETRVLDWLRQVAARRGKRLVEWSYSTGLVQAGEGETQAAPGRARQSPSRDPLVALDDAMAGLEPALFVFKDLHPFLARSSFAVIRKLKEAAQHMRDSSKTVVLVSPVLELPPELEKDVTVVDFPLPRRDDLGRLLDRILAEVGREPGLEIDLAGEAREQLLAAASGLTLTEAENVFARILVACRRLTGAETAQVYCEKRQIIRRSGLLDYIETDADMAQVGGLGALKGWLGQRAEAATERARAFGLPAPRGVLLLGVQGCGKSLCAKAVAALWHRPLLRLDVGRMFGSLVGSSEENMRRALLVAESIAPVVLWLDEIDKALSGSASSGSTDGGTAARVLGTFLTWLSEKTSAVFVVATANDITGLPPELLRKGRFDEIFFIDLPGREERAEIFRIHLARKGRDPRAFDLDRLAAASEGMSGAEVEEAVVAALYEAFAEGEELSGKAVERAIHATVPLSRTLEEELGRLRRWAEGRARFASARAEAPGRERRLEL